MKLANLSSVSAGALTLAAMAVSGRALADGPLMTRAESRLFARRDQVAQATVTVPAKGCAGVVAGDRSHVVTAAHCVPFGVEELEVRFRNGRSTEGSIVHLDRDSDLAVIALPDPAQAEPLTIAKKLPAAGDPVLFVGRIDRKSRAQIARVERLGRCPSLPSVDDALFTSIQAKPGDSGSPIVDGDLRVVGLIHGGAQCHIATPTAPLADRLGPGGIGFPAPANPLVADSGHDADLDRFDVPDKDEPVEKRYKAGPFVFEKTPHGFRFHWSFHFGFGDKDSEPSRQTH